MKQFFIHPGSNVTSAIEDSANQFRRKRKRMLKNKREMRCSSIYKKNSRFFVFYDKGLIRCLSLSQLVKYTNTSRQCILIRLKRWSIDQIVGREPPPFPPLKKKVKVDRKNPKHKQLPNEARKKQDLLKSF